MSYLISYELFLKKFADTKIPTEKIKRMYDTALRLYVYTTRASGKMHGEIMELNKVHSEVFSQLNNPKLLFYADLNAETSNKLVQLIEIEMERGKKSWPILEFTIGERVKLYKGIFMITPSDITKIQKELNALPSRFSNTVKLGALVIGIFGAGYATKKTFDYITRKNDKEKK